MRCSVPALLALGLSVMGSLTQPACSRKFQEVNPFEFTKKGPHGTVIEWLECQECIEGELDALRDRAGQGRFRNAAIGELAEVLRQGPPPRRMSQMERSLLEDYAGLVKYAQTHPEAKPASSRDEFVQRFLSNFRASYRIRAALGLAEIGGQEAREVLQEAARTPSKYRKDVQRVIGQAVATVRGQAAALKLEEDRSLTPNGPGNPVARGGVIVLYATGDGRLFTTEDPPGPEPPVVRGALADSDLPVRVTIGRLPAQVLFSGQAPGMPAGVMQVNAVVPERVSPGDNVTVVITVGDLPSQDGATIVVN